MRLRKSDLEGSKLGGGSTSASNDVSVEDELWFWDWFGIILELGFMGDDFGRLLGVEDDIVAAEVW